MVTRGICRDDTGLITGRGKIEKLTEKGFFMAVAPVWQPLEDCCPVY